MTLIMSFLHVGVADAAPNLEVKAELGVGNKVKYNTPLPLQLTITNSGSSFSGDLVIDAAESYAVGSGLVYPLDIAEGETKTIQLYLDGLSDHYMYSGNQTGSLFYFYEGGIEEGKRIKYKGNKVANTQFHDQYSTFVYTLTENSDRLAAFLRLQQHSSNNVEVSHLNQLKNFELPTNSKGYGSANVLAIDEVSIADMTKEQQQAIEEWVRQGGTLLIGASDQVEASVGIFKDQLPLTLSTERVFVSQGSLEMLSKNGIFTEGIEVYRAQEKEGSNRLLADGETVLASEIALGNGKVVQTTFSLGDQPLASMDGYSQLLVEVLKLQSPNTSMNYGYHQYQDYLPHEIGSVNELFPSFEVSTKLLVVVIVLYILFIGVILYFILKRMDKREHAWWIIPVVSIALSLVMFVFGARDRLTESQIQQSAFYKVEGDQLNGHYVQSILTNRGGDFTFTTDTNTTAAASSSSYMYNSSSDVLHEKSYVKYDANGSTIKFRNLNYWSVQSIVGKSTIPNAGNMDIQLTLKNEKIEGTIKNNFPFTLKDVAVWSGMRETVLGDIKPGETLSVSEKVKGSVLLTPSVSNYPYSSPQKKEDLVPMRIEKLKYASGNLVQGERLPAITAWAEEALVGIELDGNAKMSPISYIIQSFEPKLELTGNITLDIDMLQSYVQPTTAGYADLLNEQTNEWYIDRGEYDYNVWIPEELLENTNWTEIHLKNRAFNRLDVAIWNNETSTFEDVTEKSVQFTNGVGQYISEDGLIRMKVNFNDERDGHVKMPHLEIKGVAK